MDIIKKLESAFQHLEDGGEITRACIEYSQKNNSMSTMAILLRVRSLIEEALRDLTEKKS